MNKRLALWLSAGLVASGLGTVALASDHDDGQTEVKSKALNLTDLYVFREGDQTGNSADNDNLILIMNTNDRSLARQEYFWNTNARYEFHLTRRASPEDAVTAADDVLLRFEFGAPNASGEQAMTITAIMDGRETSVSSTVGGNAIMTTPLSAADTPVNNDVDIDGSTLTVFSGLREDPFFFDVEAFFRVRAALAGFGPAAGFRTADEAVDFTAGYNVNSLVVRVPISFLTGASGATTFDVWETISLLQ